MTENKMALRISSIATVVYVPNKVARSSVIKDITTAVEIIKLYKSTQTITFSILFIFHSPKAFVMLS